ncbi:hypothetical protein AB0H07_35940 [Streptomyces sp. NPDC021354]
MTNLQIRAHAEFLAGETNLVVSTVNTMGRPKTEQLYGPDRAGARESTEA